MFKKTEFILTLCIIVGFFASLFAIPFMPIDGNEKDIMLVLVGMVAAKFGSIIDFYFGSSSSSRTKDETISSLKKGE
jgi:uncharacterized membrane protein YeaQ/YmgE (transglycosylase-associated protein family)